MTMNCEYYGVTSIHLDVQTLRQDAQILRPEFINRELFVLSLCLYRRKFREGVAMTWDNVALYFDFCEGAVRSQSGCARFGRTGESSHGLYIFLVAGLAQASR